MEWHSARRRAYQVSIGGGYCDLLPGWRIERHTIELSEEELSGHGGGDKGLSREFYRLLSPETDYSNVGNALESAVHSHTLAFAAEEARATGTVVSLAAYEAKVAASLM